MPLGYTYTEDDKRKLCEELRKNKHTGLIMVSRIHHACIAIGLVHEPTISTVKKWMSIGY